MNEDKLSTIEMAADIVSAYVEKNSLPADQLPDFIRRVHEALATAGAPSETPLEKPAPAVPIRKSVNPDFLICLEDGKQFKSLKRHLRTRYNMSPEEYRARWALPKDYPMVAPNYAAARSQLAKSMGLGQGGRQARAGASKTASRKPKA